MRNKKEIERLFHTHYQKMYLLAMTLLHDEDESRDAASEVFADMLESSTPLYEKSAGNFLLVCVRNKCMNIISRKKTAERMRRLLPLDTAADITPPEQEGRQLDEMLTYIDRELTPQTRNIVHLRFSHGLRYHEIAAETGISRTAVYKHLAQAIRKLRTHFSPYTDDEKD
ncbi:MULTISPECIES: sigma-70 family RNA polymerase sigma factor [Prevotellaceae]|uniref:sigma-70 family RNA polymerase sigma factor n=1 Tax=Prevotellaceae TaxID=171552 RepID=UPI0003D29F02|nr:sigma-70 family RNA polymerase sigma factor [Prevotella phocaeensis]ETD16375.1 hypothetical protein HMPREF1199_02038 [Hoylesella oralis CC98A]